MRDVLEAAIKNEDLIPDFGGGKIKNMIAEAIEDHLREYHARESRRISENPEEGMPREEMRCHSHSGPERFRDDPARMEILEKELAAGKTIREIHRTHFPTWDEKTLRRAAKARIPRPEQPG